LHLLYCDETNLEARSGDFLIYGGLLIEAHKAHDLSRALDRVRAKHGVPRDYPLKFNPGPTGISHSAFADLKQQVLELAIEHGARLIVYVILHDIAKSPDEARLNGINTVCYHFDCILNRQHVDGPGLVLIDRFNDAGNRIKAHLKNKFTIGLQGMPFTREMRLSNIIGFHYSEIGQAHFPSIIDVALGSLRFAINAHTRGTSGNLATAQKLLTVLEPMFWREAHATSISDLGFCFSPKDIRVARYRCDYKSLQDYLAGLGIKTLQCVGDRDGSTAAAKG
jgi:hypothetical protein